MDTDNSQPLSEWRPITDFPPEMRASLRWFLRSSAIIEAGAAVRFGRRWLINTRRLPSFLKEQTLQARRV